ncbi:MAG TPA: NADH-quinone oxidoreductase subunit M [Terrimicrobiaceae bacterium]|nr:NADH-quinone oxidoreductase subunit M [Terrimicrobiaceae bacterium]
MSPLFCLVILPIAGAALTVAGTRPRDTAVTAAALNFLASLIIFGWCKPDAGYQFVSSFPVIPSLGIHFTLGADGLSVAILLLSTAVTLAAVCIARTPAKHSNWFYASLLLISAGAVGAFASVDAFFFYMFHELALIPTFLLIGIWGSGDRQAAAWKVTTYLALGSFILLIGLIGLYLSLPVNERTFDMRRITELAASGEARPQGSVYLLLILGFGILVSLFPFHTWAPQAYASAPAPAAMLHAGVLKKFGLYGILRLVTPVFHPDVAAQFNTLLIVLVLGNILYVGLVTISQRKLDLMLAYASVMHMGYIFLGLLSWKTLGLAGAALMLVAHGLSIAALFALSGELRERTGTLDFGELGGLAKAMPAFGLLFGFAAMSAVGLPGFANFAGELLIFFGAFSAGAPSKLGLNEFQIATVVALWGVVISTIFMLRSYRRIFMGPIGDKWKALPDIATVPRLCVTGLLVLLLIAGFFPQAVLNYVVPALMWP